MDYERAYGWKSNTFNESEMALFSECMLQCARKVLDTADIVREAWLHKLSVPNCFGTLSVAYTGAYSGYTSPGAVSEITDCHTHGEVLINRRLSEEQFLERRCTPPETRKKSKKTKPRVSEAQKATR
jgi:hypothetical protein